LPCEYAVLEMALNTLHRDGAPLLRDIALRLSTPGLLFLMGPGGAGKSTLLRTLAGLESDDGAFRLLGEVHHRSLVPPRTSADVSWLAQGARCEVEAASGLEALTRELGLDADAARDWCRARDLGAVFDLGATPSRSARRLLRVAVALARPARLIILDEPTAGMDDAHADWTRKAIAARAREALVVVATHNRRDCVPDTAMVALLAGGTLQEFARVDQFFASPTSPAGRDYVATGSCHVPARDTVGARPDTAATRADATWWVTRGLLGGRSRPGITEDAREALRDLHAQGVRHLVCLEETVTYPVAAAREEGLAHYHFPTPDMAPPTQNQLVDLCRTLEPGLRANEGVVLHCKGGLGRTGTALAAILVWFGDSAEAAIARVRAAKPLAIQTPAQQRSISEFAERISAWHAPR
jgi:atypical dual specificity phosphatase